MKKTTALIGATAIFNTAVLCFTLYVSKKAEQAHDEYSSNQSTLADQFAYTPIPTVESIISKLPADVAAKLNNSPNKENVLQAVIAAELETGCPAELLTCIMARESGFDFDPPKSSKTGPMQINAQTTGIEMIRNYGKDLGFHGLVDKVNIIDNANASRRDKKQSVQAIKDALKNPYVAACLTAAKLKSSTLHANKHLYEKKLTPSLRRIEDTPCTDLYLTHLLGCEGAKDMLAAYYNPRIKNTWSVKDYVRESAFNNPGNRSIFFKNNAAKSIEEFYNDIAATMPTKANAIILAPSLVEPQ